MAAGRSENKFAGLWLGSFALRTKEEHRGCELFGRTTILDAVSRGVLALGDGEYFIDSQGEMMVTQSFLDKRDQGLSLDILCEREVLCTDVPITLQLDSRFGIACHLDQYTSECAKPRMTEPDSCRYLEDLVSSGDVICQGAGTAYLQIK